MTRAWGVRRMQMRIWVPSVCAKDLFSADGDSIVSFGFFSCRSTTVRVPEPVVR